MIELEPKCLKVSKSDRTIPISTQRRISGGETRPARLAGRMRYAECMIENSVTGTRRSLIGGHRYAAPAGGGMGLAGEIFVIVVGIIKLWMPG